MTFIGRNNVDLERRGRLTRSPRWTYVEWQNFSLTVGLNVVSLSNEVIAVNYAIIQSDNANFGTIEIGGSNLGPGAGIQLTAGQAISYSTTPSEESTGGSLGGGIQPTLLPQGGGFVDRLLSGRNKRLAINLRNIRVVANLANQIVRVMYTVPPLEE